jgi:N-acyl-D-amino-acid deacylase
LSTVSRSALPAPCAIHVPEQARTIGSSAHGMAADITVFDAGAIDEAATFAKPIQPAKGIETVIVNGEVIWRDGKTTGARPGRVLRRAA